MFMSFQSFITGYSMKRKIWLSLTVTPVVIAILIALIADVDDPRSGLIRVQQKTMDRLAKNSPSIDSPGYLSAVPIFQISGCLETAS
jgi:hypothetical protein